MMNKNAASIAIALLLSLGVTACSSGGSSEPGVSAKDYALDKSLEIFKARPVNAQSDVTSAQEALETAKAALATAQTATTEADARVALRQVQAALSQAEKAAKDAQYKAREAEQAANSLLINNRISSDDTTVSETQALAAQADEIAQQIANILKEAEMAVEVVASQEAAAKKEAEEQAIASELAARHKESTTSYSYNRSDSVVHDYADVEKRDQLLAEIKKNENLTAGSVCSTGSASRPGECFAGGTIGTGERKGEEVEGYAKGTVLGSYAQSYSGYALIREEYSNLNNANTGDANAYIALSDSSQLVKDKALVTDATYEGTATYSTRGRANANTDSFVMTVKDDAISGWVYRSTTNGRGVTNTRTYVQFQDATINVDNGVVGFDGNALINISASQIEGTSPSIDSLVDGKGNEVSGTYQGVFVGPNAKEVVGTFETNADVENSVRGAFAGSK